MSFRKFKKSRSVAPILATSVLAGLYLAAYIYSNIDTQIRTETGIERSVNVTDLFLRQTSVTTSIDTISSKELSISNSMRGDVPPLPGLTLCYDFADTFPTNPSCYVVNLPDGQVDLIQNLHRGMWTEYRREDDLVGNEELFAEVSTTLENALIEYHLK